MRRLLRPKWWWMVFWMRFAGLGRFGRFAARMAALAAPPYKHRRFLASLHPLGYVSATAEVDPGALHRGAHVFVGDRVVVYRAGADAGRVELGGGSCIHRDTIIELGSGGAVEIGPDTHIQAGCLLAAHLAPVRIGRGVQIAAGCRFYSFNHGFAAGVAVAAQPLTTKGGIVIEDDVWVGAGVTVLDGARIGRGAVIGAGALVNGAVPPDAIAVGAPARVVGYRAGRP